MKKTGLIILVIGILITIFTGFNYITKEKVVDIGEIQITRDKKHSVGWSPLIGVAVMAVGGGIMLFGMKK
ncbi:MAG: hypothetical protein JJU28_18890 [Cyclobacteriaceae bacterium]|nr:hypothetical protein [Cyclobacteriaceae bacterium]